MADLKTSLLINRQVPEYIREEYPLFISFLEAYYEFLENKQGSEKNDLTTKSKELRNLSDVDASIEDFEESFFNNFASLFPRDARVDKSFLIKNVLPLYLAKGSEESFKFLFRLLFDSEVDVVLPKNNVLRASDGQWTIDNILRIETDVRSVYTGDGTTTTFRLAQTVDSDDIQVYLNDVLQTVNVDFSLRKETRKVIFNTAPTSGSSIQVFYNNFDPSILNNRRITGLTSGATALVESGVPRIITDRLNFGLPFELFINSKTLIKEFFNGEIIRTDVVDSDGNLIFIEADTFSILTKINVIESGASYNVGDPVSILGGGATLPATAEVESVTDGYTSRLVINAGGSGFKIASLIQSNVSPVVITGSVDAVNTSHYTANTYRITSDVILDYKDVVISDADYGFPGSFTENVNTRIVDALTPAEVTDLGPITNAIILFANTTTNTTNLDTQGAIYQVTSNNGITYLYDIKDFQSIGRIDVNDGGLSYNVGDEIVFTDPVGTFGYGAAAAVSSVAANGMIQSIQVQAPRITGTANIANGNAYIHGTNTLFTTELQVGDKIVISCIDNYISSIVSDTVAVANNNWRLQSIALDTNSSNNQNIGSYALGAVGGVNYDPTNLPTVTVSSENGSGADIQVVALMGDGENLGAFSDAVPGSVLSIKLTSGGVGYEFIPEVDLSNYGDGTATANADLGSSYATLPGRWLTSDSILSSSERKLAGSKYYIDYSYVTSSLVEFSRYKSVLKQLLHPSGFVNYATFRKEIDVEVRDANVVSSTTTAIPGSVSVTNGSTIITGTGTKFNVSNSLGILTVGSNVAVYDEIRTVDSIISNTSITVSSAFSSNITAQTLIVLT